MTESRRAARDAMSEALRQANLACAREHRSSWFVNVYRANYSKFNGSRYTPSDYSEVHCRDCGRVWRTKAAYVDQLPRSLQIPGPCRGSGECRSGRLSAMPRFRPVVNGGTVTRESVEAVEPPPGTLSTGRGLHLLRGQPPMTEQPIRL